MTTLRASSCEDAARSAIKLILDEGAEVSPRGIKTREVPGLSITIDRPNERWFQSPIRGFSPAFAIAETIWILMGSNDDWVYQYNPALRKFHDPDAKAGVYGPRLRRWPNAGDQLATLVETLRADPDTRRAVLQIFNPSEDTARSKDIPCTLSHRFLIRDKKLLMFTTMRSQDAWLGLPYDLFFASVLQELVAGWLNIEVGARQHHADSFHIYEDSLEQARAFSLESPSESRSNLESISVPFDQLGTVMKNTVDDEPTGFVAWDQFRSGLTAYRAHKNGQNALAAQIVDSLPLTIRDSFLAWFQRNNHHETRFP